MYFDHSGIDESWLSIFVGIKPEFDDIIRVLDRLAKPDDRQSPEPENVFGVFNHLKLENVKVVVLYSCPYNTVNQNGDIAANGLGFGVDRECKVPKELEITFKQISNTVLGFEIPNHGDLTKWINQGVLMLPMSMTTIIGKKDPCGQIWYGFIYKILKAVVAENPKCVFGLLGSKAKIANEMIGESRYIITGSEPNPEYSWVRSSVWFDINKALKDQKLEPIEW